MTASPFASLALFAWPVIALVLFAALGRERGLIWSVSAGYLFLPDNFGHDLAGLPSYDKTLAIALGIVLGGLVSRRAEAPAAPPARGIAIVIVACLFVLAVLSPVLTWRANMAPIVTGGKLLPGLGARDAISYAADAVIFGLPFVAGWLWLRRPEDRRELLLALAAFGLVYAGLALIEMRLSPQLNKWIYGYFPHSFGQHWRNGWRPILFLQHGLWVGFFFFSAMMAALALARARPEWRAGALATAGWLLIVLFFSRNVAAFLIAVVLGAVLLTMGLRNQLRVAAALGATLIVYPALFQYDLVPLDQLLGLFGHISSQRAESLAFRFENEAGLVERALESPWVGLGQKGRSLTYYNGYPAFTVDGYWIIVWGMRGWLGYVAQIGIMVFPILALWWRGRREVPDAATAGLALIMAGNFVYLIPNATLTPLGIMVAGAVAAAATWRVTDAAASGATATAAAADRGLRYTRFSDEAPAAGRGRGGGPPLRRAGGAAPAVRRSPLSGSR